MTAERFPLGCAVDVVDLAGPPAVAARVIGAGYDQRGRLSDRYRLVRMMAGGQPWLASYPTRWLRRRRVRERQLRLW